MLEKSIRNVHKSPVPAGSFSCVHSKMQDSRDPWDSRAFTPFASVQ